MKVPVLSASPAISTLHGCGLEAAGVLGRIGLVGAELVEIVVVGDVVVGVRLVASPNSAHCAGYCSVGVGRAGRRRGCEGSRAAATIRPLATACASNSRRCK